MRRLAVLIAVMAVLGTLAAPAAAHNLEVRPPGNDHEVDTTIGGPILTKAKGQGLYPASPEHPPTARQSASHGAGLNQSCKATGANPVVTIYGPPFAHSCNHGGPPPPPPPE